MGPQPPPPPGAPPPAPYPGAPPPQAPPGQYYPQGAPAQPPPGPYQTMPATTPYPPQPGFPPPPTGAYPMQQPQMGYPAGTSGQPGYPPPPPGAVVVPPQPVYIQQGRTPGYQEGVCSCGADLGASHWTWQAWLMCICCCPFNFCYPYCMPEARVCTRCGKEYYKPV